MSIRNTQVMAQFLLAIQDNKRHNAAMFKNLLMAGLAAIVVPAFAAEWMTDLNAARTKAAAENKAVLVDFTGSDWCGYCIRLKKAVFDTPEFESYAADKFVLVEIDVPNDVNRVGGPAQLAKNQALCNQYNVSGFPTIMVLNADNNVLGGFVGGQPTLEATQVPLDAALANGRKLQAAKSLQGVEKAKVLMEVYKSLPEELQPAASEMMQEIAALDPENATGIQELAKEAKIIAQVEADIRACREADEAMAVVDKALPHVTGLNKQKLAEIKFMIIQSKIDAAAAKAETTEDILAIKAMMMDTLEFVPEQHRAAVKANIEKQFANPAAVLKQIKSMRRK